MKISKQTLPKSQLELTIELSIEELEPYLKDAATELVAKKPIEGFRPGKAPYDIIVQRFGAMAIMQQASNAIIGKTFYQAIEQEGIEIVDQPSIDVVKSAPDNPFIFKATVSLLPNVELADYHKLSVDALPKIKVEDDNVDKVITDLQEMRAKEVITDRAAKQGDKVEVNFETFVEKIAIPGGKSEKYPMIIGRGQMIPGFEDHLVGLKKDQEKEFELNFPNKYHSEKLAGKKAKFKIKIVSVYNREMPPVDDAFANAMGLKTILDLRSQIRNNLSQEQQGKAQQKQDIDIVTAIIDKSKFEDLPDTLITAETHKMIEELKDNVSRQGLQFEDYLNHLKKKEGDLMLDFTPDALKRVKTGLAIRAIAVKENLSASEIEVTTEADKTLKSYQMNPQYTDQLEQIEANIKTQGAHRYFANLVTNRKVMNLLRKVMVKGESKTSKDKE